MQQGQDSLITSTKSHSQNKQQSTAKEKTYIKIQQATAKKAKNATEATNAKTKQINIPVLTHL